MALRGADTLAFCLCVVWYLSFAVPLVILNDSPVLQGRLSLFYFLMLCWYLPLV